MKLTSLNYQQRNRNLHLDSLSRKIHSETERRQRYMETKSHWKKLLLIMKGFSHQMESIYWSLFLSFIHLLLHKLSNGYRNLFDILNNKYQCCTNQIRISSNTANLLNYSCVSVNCRLYIYRHRWVCRKVTLLQPWCLLQQYQGVLQLYM